MTLANKLFVKYNENYENKMILGSLLKVIA